MTTTIRALSIARPWAGLVVHGHKPVENRTWSTRYRGPLIVHASQRWDRYVADIPRLVGMSGSKHDHPTGYIGVVCLADVHHASECDAHSTSATGCSPWAEPDTWHWVMTDPHAFPTHLPGPGQLGLYAPPDHAIARCPHHLLLAAEEAGK